MQISATPVCSRCGNEIITYKWYIDENGAQICIVCGIGIIAQETYKKASLQNTLIRGFCIFLFLMLFIFGITAIKSAIEQPEYRPPITFKEYRGEEQ